jgi:hypothetical protein
MSKISIFLPRNLVSRGDLLLYRTEEKELRPSRKSPILFKGVTEKGTPIELVSSSTRQFWEDSQQENPERADLWNRLFKVLSENPNGCVVAEGDFFEAPPVTSEKVDF